MQLSVQVRANPGDDSQDVQVFLSVGWKTVTPSIFIIIHQVDMQSYSFTWIADEIGRFGLLCRPSYRNDSGNEIE
jgi:hypothetical protein